MKIILDTELSDKENSIYAGEENVTQEDFKEELKQMLFEVCEDWVLKGQEPQFTFTKE